MKKNARILFALLAVAVAFAGAGCTAKAKKAWHLSRADRYYKAGQFGPAEIEYINTLRSDRENIPATTRLGLIYYEEGRLQRAAYFLAKASELSPDNLELRLKLGFIYSSAGLYSNALVQANYVLGKKPLDDQAPILLAEASMLRKDAAAARQRLEAMARNGDRAELEVALGDLALRENDLAAANAAFKKAQTLNPKSPAVNTALANAAQEQGDLKAAEAYYQAAAEASPIRSPRRMQYARFKVQTGDLAGARAVLAEISKAAPDYMPASMVLAEIAFSEKKFDECAGLLEQVQKLDPENHDALLYQGQLDLARGKPDQAVTDMERMARMFPQLPGVQFQLGVAYLAAKNPEKAAASLERALEINPNFSPATLLLAEIQITKGNVDPAIAALERLRQKQPGLVRGQLLLADAYRLRNRVSEAVAIYKALETKYPTNSQVVLLHGAALLQTKDHAAARKAFERVLALSPGDLTAIEALVDISLSEKQFDAATQLINREIQNQPKRVALQLLATKIQLAQGQYNQAEATLLQALKIEPDNPGAGLLLAQLYSDTGQYEKAMARLNTFMAKNPENTSALMLTAQIYSANTNLQAAADTYEKLLKIDPKFSPALNNLAYLYSESLNHLDRAYELAERARQLLPLDPSTADTLGWIDFKRGAYEAALGLLKESGAKLPGEPEVQFHLGLAAYMAADETTARAALQQAWQTGTNFPGRSECQLCLSILEVNPANADPAVRAMLEKRVAQKPGDPVALARLARIHLREGNTDQAIAAYEAILRAVPQNLDAMINLARLYAPKDTRKAYDLAKAAGKLAPYDSQVSHTLGRLAFLAGDYLLAADVLRQALQNQPNDAALLFDFAQAGYAVGKVAAAQASLQSALGLNLPAAQAAQARRMSELITLAADPAQAAAAGARIAEILKAEPDDVPALMVRAVASEFASDRAAAEQACEKVLARYPDFVPAQQQLARLYTAEPGKLDRAGILAEKAHQALPDDPSAAKLLGVILVQRGDYDRALTVLKQCAFKLSSDPEVEYYMGTAQFHLNSRAESKVSLQKALALKLTGPLADSAKQMLTELKK
jgi:tetratricopeptide (TPR) repeat protein